MARELDLSPVKGKGVGFYAYMATGTGVPVLEDMTVTVP